MLVYMCPAMLDLATPNLKHSHRQYTQKHVVKPIQRARPPLNMIYGDMTWAKTIYQCWSVFSCLPACLSVCQLACLPACLSVCQLACLPACLHVCQLVYIGLFSAVCQLDCLLCLLVCLFVSQWVYAGLSLSVCL